MQGVSVQNDKFKTVSKVEVTDLIIYGSCHVHKGPINILFNASVFIELMICTIYGPIWNFIVSN